MKCKRKATSAVCTDNGNECEVASLQRYLTFLYITLSVIVKTCSDSLFSIGQKNCQLFVAKLRNFLDSHNRMVLY